jgi:hypothetical protein
MRKFGVIIDIQRFGHLSQLQPSSSRTKALARRASRCAIPRQGDHVHAVSSEQKSGANHRSEKNPDNQTWQENHRILSESGYEGRKFGFDGHVVVASKREDNLGVAEEVIAASRFFDSKTPNANPRLW